MRDLLFPGKKPKEVLEGGEEDSGAGEEGGERGDGEVKGWFDGHPEIGKMQKVNMNISLEYLQSFTVFS